MQQINLHQASLRPTRQVMTMMQLGLAASMLLLVLVAITSVQSWWLHHTNLQLSEAKLQETELTQANERLNKQLAQSSNDTELKQTISNKATDLQDKQFVLKALTGKQFGNTTGFAAQFTGLARQHVEGVWLTGLYIHAGGKKLNLQGRTSAAELVPRYLQRLAQEPSFQGIEFQTLLMQRVDKSSQIDFDLRSTPKEPG